MVPCAAVDRAAHRVGHEAAGHAFALDPRMQLQRGIEGALVAPIGDELEAEEKPATADVADMRMVGEGAVSASPALPRAAHPRQAAHRAR